MLTNFGLILGCVACAPDFSNADWPELCPIHKARLERMIVPLTYGEPCIATPEEVRERGQRFPYAVTTVNGGCVVDQKHSRATVRACRYCNQAETAWFRVHEPCGGNPPATPKQKSARADDVPPNIALRPSHSRLTALAKSGKRRADWRAGYAQRYAYKN